MTNSTINIDIDALTEDFKVHCKVIKLGYEYPGYTGTEKYAIVTDLSYAQIMERYAPLRTARPSATTLNAPYPILQKLCFGISFHSDSWEKRLQS